MEHHKSEKQGTTNPFGQLLRGKVVFVGIGNILRGDDGLGPVFVEGLKDNVNAVCINAENVPENYFGRIVKENPDTIIIIDAVYLDRRPGDYTILTGNELMTTGFSTHDISPSVLIEYLNTLTEADIYVLGVQPQNIDLGKGISGRIEQTLRYLESMIIEALPPVV